MSIRRQGRLAAGSAVALLLLAGCGHSSPARTAATATAQTTAGAPTSTAPAPSAASTGRLVASSANGVRAMLHAGTHHPRVGRPWPVRFTVTRAGGPVSASVSYEWLYGGQVVGRRSHYRFVGHFSDTFIWPSAAVGYPLTFRAVVVSGGTTINLDYPVQVSR